MSLSQFEVLGDLGNGAFSSVQKVKRLKDNQIYALKKMKLTNFSKKEKQNALNQIRILASVQSPYIISYKEAFVQPNENLLCLVTEFADNGDLQQKIKNTKKDECLPQDQIWKILLSISKGLQALHKINIAHRDIKPANIFLFSDGRVKIGDMNVSKVLKGQLCYTQTGTPYYASPEIWKDIPYSIKSDIWSLGCIIYELAALKPPFQASSMEELYKKIIRGIFPKLPSMYSKELRSIIRKMIRVQPSSRPQIDKVLEFSEVKVQNKAQNEEEVDFQLMESIKLPKKLGNLAYKLPSPKYTGSKTKYDSLIHEKTKKKASFRILPSITKSKNSIEEASIQRKTNKNPKINKVKSEKILPSRLPSIALISDDTN